MEKKEDAEIAMGALSRLAASSMDALAESLALADPTLLLALQKAASDARRRQTASAPKAKHQGAQNPVAYSQARRLLESSFNAENLAKLNAIAQGGLDLGWHPENEPSLMGASLDYLKARDRVELDWPPALLEAGCPISALDLRLAFECIDKRNEHSLGTNKVARFALRLMRDFTDWPSFLALPKNEQPDWCSWLLEKNGHYDSEDFFSAMSLLVKAGIQPAQLQGDKPKARKSYGYGRANSNVNSPFWQRVITISSDVRRDANGSMVDGPHPAGAQAKIQTLRDMHEKGWIAKGFVYETDDLSLGEDTQNAFLDCPSRSFIFDASLDEAFVPSLRYLCDLEEQDRAWRRFDALGRSRLYCLNTRAREHLSHHRDGLGEVEKIIMEAGQECLERGDDPRTIASQNPKALAAGESMRKFIDSNLERVAIEGALPAASGAKAPKKQKSRL